MHRALLVVVGLLLCGAPPLQAQQVDGDPPWSVRMAQSVMEREPDLMDSWNYEFGIVLKAINEVYEATGEEQYWDYVKYNMDRYVQPDGDIRTYDLTDYNLDQINAGKLLFPLYERTGDERYRIAMDTLRKQLREHPRTSEGGFWHKKIYPYQLWLDGVYMAGPFLARYGVELDDEEALDEVAHEILLVARYMRDPATGLFYHGWDESRTQRWADNQTGLSKNFWGRGMGWYGMALVDVLDYLPEDHPQCEAVIDVLQKFAAAVENIQDPVSGTWWQVLDKPAREENYLEASVSNMFVYMLLKGVRGGYLDEGYLEVAQRGYEGILDEFIEVTDEGLVNLNQTVSVGGLGGDDMRDGTFEYYMSEPLRVNDSKGVGPFIMASLLMEELQNAPN